MENTNQLDTLTGVYTREYLNHALAVEIKKAHKNDAEFSMLILDLDYFKTINDAFGHLRGDRVLKEFITRIQAQIRTREKIFRFGGDEFIILLSNTNKAQAEIIARRLIDNVASKPFEGFPPLNLSISIGIARYPADGTSVRDLIDTADRRLLQAKRSGRGRLVSENINEDLMENQRYQSRLIERDQNLMIAHRFFERLADHHRGIMMISGAPGTGRTRFLAEVQSYAIMRGYGILAIRGKPALKYRVYGALTEALHQRQDIPLPSLGKNNFIGAVQQYIHAKELQGLIITLDELQDIDWNTLQLIHDLFHQSALEQIGLVYISSSSMALRGLPREATLREVIPVRPLTPNGIRIWLREQYQGEFPLEFIQWLHHHTRGLPANIEKGLQILIDQSILIKEKDGIQISPSYALYPLTERLEEIAVQPPHNFPQPATEFIGREEEIQALKQLIEECPLVNLIGIGGMGKTRLAVQVATEILENFKDGGYFVPLAPLSNPNFVVYAISDAIGLSLNAPQDPQTQLINYLRSKEILLLLDNFEHLTSAAPFLQAIMDQAPGVRLFVTSRQKLNISEETTYTLSGLPYPAPDQASEIEEYSSLQLFLRTARRVHPEFTLTTNDTPHIAQICRILEGVPLGIELSAVWVQAYTCAEIASGIEQSLSFLTPTLSDQAGIQRGLAAVFEAFWTLLFDHERSVLRMLSMFSGSFSQNAALKIANASPFFLDALSIKSYLQRPEPDRFEMHELLRQYLADKLRQNPQEYANVEKRFCEYYITKLEQRGSRLRSELGMLHTINADLENFRLAWKIAIKNNWVPLVLRSIDTMMTFYDLRGMFLEAESTALELAAQISQLIPSKSKSRREELLLLARLEMFQARFLNQRGLYEQALENAQSALRIAQPFQANELKAAIFCELGEAHWRKGLFKEATGILRKALKYARIANSQELESEAIYNLGLIDYCKGNYTSARLAFQEYLQRVEATGNLHEIGSAYNSLGLVHEAQNDYTLARQYFTQSLEISQQIGDRRGEGIALNNLGLVLQSTADFQGAEQCIEKSLRLDREMGDISGEGIALNNLGLIARCLGLFTKSESYFQQSLEISSRLGDRDLEGDNLAELSLLYLYMGNLSQSLEYCQKSLQLSKAIGSRSTEGYANHRLGRVLNQLGRYDDALDAYQQALIVRNNLEQKALIVETLSGIALTYHNKGNLKDSLRQVETILRYLEKESLDGTEDPLGIYLICYRILAEMQDQRAWVLLQSAYQQLQSQAEQITDPRILHAFFENVPTHRAILSTWNELTAKTH